MPVPEHLASYEDLVTPYAATRAGFIALALERNKEALAPSCQGRPAPRSRYRDPG